MGWEAVVPPVIAAGAALLGVHYGVKSTESRESLNWIRDQRLKAYSDVLDAVDRMYAAFGLINAQLALVNYQVNEELPSKVQTSMEDWGRWDEKLDEVLPRAELVASQTFQVQLSVGIRLGMRTRHRMLLMMLTHSGQVDEREWKSVATTTLGDLSRFREKLRADLAKKDTSPSTLHRVRVQARKVIRIARR